MKRCIIYARIGGPASEVNNSLMQAQLAGLRTTAKGLGLEVVAELPVFEYGADGNRQSIQTGCWFGSMPMREFRRLP